MKKSLLAVTIALAFSSHAQVVLAQAAISTGGAGGAGGSAQGGTATGGSAQGGTATGGTATNSNNSSTTGGTAEGGAASNSNTLTTTGGRGGSGGQGGLGGAASGGSASATGVQTGAINSTGNNQAAEITVNYIQPSSPGGLKGLAAGVDPESGHFVNDNNVRYSGTQKIKNTPDASIGGPASGPCNGFSGGIGVSVPGFAVGANTSTVDPGCTARETARIAAMLGRMDIANAVLENTSVVQEALKAKAARLAAEAQSAPVATAPVYSAPPQVAPPQAAPVQGAPARPAADRDVEEARLKEQQRFAVETLQRKATMDKVYDTLTFTDLVSQGGERTPQQAMADEATKRLAERTKRQEDQLKLERRLAALKAEPPQNSLEPLVPNTTLASAKPDVAPAAAPVATALAAHASAAPTSTPQSPAGTTLAATAPAAPTAAAPAAEAPATAAPATAAPATAKVPQPALDPAEAAKLLRNVEPAVGVASTPTSNKVAGEVPQRPTAPPAPGVRAPEEPTQLGSQPMLKNVKVDKLNELFGFKSAKPATDEVMPEAPVRQPAPKATEAAAKPAGLQATNRDAAAEKPAGDTKKVPVQPADALNFARAPISVQ